MVGTLEAYTCCFAAVSNLRGATRQRAVEMIAMPPRLPDAAGGRFLTTTVEPADVFTREDLSDEQRLFGRAALEFMRGEVLPREAQIYAHDWAITRMLLRKAGELDLLRLEIPEAYGGLGARWHAPGRSPPPGGSMRRACRWTSPACTHPTRLTEWRTPPGRSCVRWPRATPARAFTAW
jgi:hypothetical protein